MDGVLLVYIHIFPSLVVGLALIVAVLVTSWAYEKDKHAMFVVGCVVIVVLVFAWSSFGIR